MNHSVRRNCAFSPQNRTAEKEAKEKEAREEKEMEEEEAEAKGEPEGETGVDQPCPSLSILRTENDSSN